jgi:hypothetical protein
LLYFAIEVSFVFSFRLLATPILLAGVTLAQKVISEALGAVQAANDLNADGKVNVVDIEIVIDAALNRGCSAS